MTFWLTQIAVPSSSVLKYVYCNVMQCKCIVSRVSHHTLKWNENKETFSV